MKHIIYLFVYIVFSQFAFSQSVGDLYLYKYPELVGYAGGVNDLKVDYDGGFFMTMLLSEDNLGAGEPPRELIVKINRNLELLYDRQLYIDNYGTTDYYLFIRSLKPLDNGEILVGGVIVRDGWAFRHIFTLKLDVNGNLAWFRRFASIEYKSHEFYHFYIDESDPDHFYYGAFYFTSEDINDLNNYQDRDLFLVKANLYDGLALSYTPLDVYDDIGLVGSHLSNVYQDRFNTDEFYLETGLYPLPLRKSTRGFIKFNTSGEVLQTHHIGRQPNYDTIPYIHSLSDSIYPFYTLLGDMAQLSSGNIAYISHGKGIINPDSSVYGHAAHFLKLTSEGEILNLHGLFPPESQFHNLDAIETELHQDSLFFAGGRMEPMYINTTGDKLGVLKLDTNGIILDSLTLPIYEGWTIDGIYSDTSGLYVWYNGRTQSHVSAGLSVVNHYIARINTETMEIDTLKSSDFEYTSHYLSDSTYNTSDIVIPIENIIGIPDLTENILVNIYPNPATEHIFWSLPDVKKVSVHNSQGKILIDQLSTESGLDISQLPSGVYTIILTQTNNKQTISKFVVE